MVIVTNILQRERKREKSIKKNVGKTKKLKKKDLVLLLNRYLVMKTK